jgi:hypothetical protein
MTCGLRIFRSSALNALNHDHDHTINTSTTATATTTATTAIDGKLPQGFLSLIFFFVLLIFFVLATL